MEQEKKFTWSPGVLVAFAVMLLVGWQIQQSQTGLMNEYSSSQDSVKITMKYPAGWAVGKGVGYTLSEFLNMSDPDVRVYVADQPGYQVSGFGIGFMRNSDNQSRYLGYRRLAGIDMTLSGMKAHELDFAYVDLSPDETVAPRVFYVKEILVPVKGGLLVFSVAAPDYKYDAAVKLFDEMMKTVTIGG